MNEENTKPELETQDTVEMEVDPAIWEKVQEQIANKQTPEDFLKEQKQEIIESQSVPSKVWQFLTDNPATRAAITAGKTQGLESVPPAFWEYTNIPAELAPTAEETAAIMGLSKEPTELPPVQAPGLVPGPQPTGPTQGMSPADIGALGISAIDPTILTPSKAMLKGVGTGLKAGAKTAVEAARPVAAGMAGATLKLMEESGEFAKALAGMELGKSESSIFKRVYGSVEEFKKAVTESTQEILKTISPDLAKGLRKKLETASRIGLDPSLLNASVLFGGDEFVAALEKFKGQAKVLPSVANHKVAIQKISNSLQESLVRAAMKGGQTAQRFIGNENLMGLEIKSLLDRRFQALSEEYPNTYKNISKQVLDKAGTQVIPWQVRRELAQKIADYGMQLNLMKSGAAGREGIIDDTLREFRKLAKSILVEDAPLDELVVKLTDYGQLANWGKKDGVLAVDEKAMKDLYHMTRQAVEDTVGILGGPDLQLKLQATNEAFSDFLTKREAILDRIQGKRGTEVYNAIFNTDEINRFDESLRSVPVPEKTGPLKLKNKEAINSQSAISLLQEIGGEEADALINAGSWNYLEGILKDRYSDVVPVSTIADLAQAKVYLFPKSLNNWSEKSDAWQKLIKMGAIDAQDVQAITDILMLGEAYGYPILNFSNTETARVISDLGSALTMPMIGNFDTFNKTGKAYLNAILDRVGTSRLISSAQREALFRALDNPLEDVISEWGPEASEMLAKLWTYNTKGDATLNLEQILAKFQNAKRVEDKTRKIAPFIPTYTESVIKALTVIKRLHESEDNRPVFVPEKDREEVLKQIKNSEISNLQKVRNMMSIQNFGYILNLAPEDVSLPTPQPGPTPEAAKKTAAEIMKDKVFKPSSKD